MKNFHSNMIIAAVVSLALVVPFMVMEYANTSGFARMGFPVSLFAALWLLQFAFVGLLLPPIQQVRAGVGLLAAPVAFLFRMVLMIAIAVVWFSLVSDQMPCFLGVPNCD